MTKSIITLTLTALIFNGIHAQTNNVEITNQFFKAYEEMDFDKMASYWDDSLKLQDFIVAEMYKIEDTYYGRQTALDLWKQAFSVKPNYIRISVREQFTSGNFVVSDLSFESSSSNNEKTAITKGEMFTIFKFHNGKITEHYDFGDYYTWGRQIRSVLKGEHHVNYPEEKNLDIARAYIDAYSHSDLEKMSSFYADDVEFKDLTAKDVFKANNFEQNGKAQVKSFWKGVLIDPKTKYLNVKIDGAFYSASYVMLNTTFAMILPASWTGGKENVYVQFPIKTILQIKEGKITKHYDFADYDLYHEQIRLQTAN